MQHSKLLSLLRTFSPTEWRQFNEWMQSPYFNKHSDSRLLTAYLYQLSLRQWPATELQPARLMAQALPEQTYDPARWRYLANLVLHQAERFLGQQQYEARPEHQWLDALTVCSERGLGKSVRHLSARLTQALAQDDELGGERALLAYRFERVRHAQQERDNQRHTEEQLRQLTAALDRYYLTQRWSLSCDLLDYQRHYPDSNLPLAEEVLELLLGPAPAQADAEIQLYRSLWRMIRSEQESETAFVAYRELLFEHGPRFPEHRRRVLFSFAINQAIRAYVQGEQQYSHYLFDLYDRGLASGFLLWDDRLSPRDYNNIAKLALGLRRFDWLEGFIDRYSDKLPAAAYTDAYQYTRADLAYHRGQYDTAMDHLNRVEFSDLTYQLGAKAMLLRIYYETGATEAFYSLAASFRLFLLRKRGLKPALRQAYQNFVRLSVRLHRRGAEQPARLRQHIETTKALNARSWLLGQLDQLGSTSRR